MDRRAKLILAMLIVIAAVLRLGGMFDDFWLDEIWSYYISQNLARPWDVLLSPAARSDNNHPLNTLFLWLAGNQPQWIVYRVPSFLAGVGTVLLAARITLRRGSTAVILATTLVGLSYPLIFFSSEARGYSLAVFFALLAFDAFERFDGAAAWSTATLFWASCIGGLLSHLSFVHVYLGLVALTAYRLARARPARVAAFNAARLHLVPLVAAGLIYAAFVRHMTIGGAPPRPLWMALCDAVCRLVAGSGPVEFQVAVTAVALIGFVSLLRALRRRGSDLWVALAVAVIVSPALAITRQALVLDYPQPMHSRYFLVLLPLVMLAASIVLARGIHDKPMVRWTTVSAVAAFIVLSLWQTVRFIRVGRGHYSDAVVYMSQQTPGAELAIVSDHPLRTGMVLEFYSRLLPPGTRIRVIDGTSARANPQSAPWLIMISDAPSAPPLPNVGPYLFDREFTYYGLSGYSWYLYRRRL
jgi:hypothetical protein